ncbi:AAA family ATPase [Acinetobacter sp. ETR1]|uniref:AAA family ATPase n=2 Tax=unclassified Acinetobacter TaxID=196816 RepID=UPI0004D81BA6|nr:AAA family ATPase [Acinetobacter sp. ETR1]KEC82608.1 type II restriction-modification system restriction subunit [Acinetobacter sp. ETR1]
MSVFELENLNDVVLACRQEYQNLPNKIDIKITSELKDLIQEEISKILSNGVSVEFSDYSITYKNRDDLIAILPSRWLWIASVFHKYAFEYFKYSDLVHGINEKLNLPKGFLKDFPKNSEPATKSPDELRFEQEIFKELRLRDNTHLNSNFDLIKMFLYERSWWNFGGSGKTLDRHDSYDSTLLGACQVIAASSDKLITLITVFLRSTQLQNLFQQIAMPYISKINVPSQVMKGENTIYYGAPGTGKSHEIDKLANDNNSVRTVFHPESQYSDFVGCLRPSMGGSGIEYSFKHGPFIQSLIMALKNPSNHFYLIIEEINRAPAAAVFGELFQLLDRDETGRSQYSIDINDKDLLKLLKNELPNSFNDNKLYIPANFSIYATMNSSDQAVMPLDSAFKRRWKFIYKPLNFSDSPAGNFDIYTEEGKKTISWSIFAKAVNAILSLESIPEDRHLGPWFVNKTEIADPKNANNALTGKIMMYLWDDVLRHSERSILFQSEIKTFGALIKGFKDKKIVFSNNFLLSVKDDVQDSIEESTEETLNINPTVEDTTGEN